MIKLNTEATRKSRLKNANLKSDSINLSQKKINSNNGLKTMSCLLNINSKKLDSKSKKRNSKNTQLK